MSEALPPIYFYLPESDRLRGHLPTDIETSWQWQVTEGRPRFGVSEDEYAWNLQTYLRLKDSGFPCEMTATFPTDGIVLTGREHLPFDLRPNPKLLIICLQADKSPHPYAQLHVVQNPRALYTELTLHGDYHFPQVKRVASQPFADRYFMRHWTQPGLIPRSLDRGDCFEKAAYFGYGAFLTPEMIDGSWQAQVEALGLQWQFKSRTQALDGWTNYSDVDVVVAVRGFDRHVDYSWKPATKLYNAWYAGIPAILGCESAYQAERQSDLDYLEVTSLDEVVIALKRLRDDPALRQAMRENGLRRAEAVKPAKTVEQWQTFLKTVAIPTYDRWRTASTWGRQAFLQRRHFAVQASAIKRFVNFKIEGIQRRLKG